MKPFLIFALLLAAILAGLVWLMSQDGDPLCDARAALPWMKCE